MLLLLGSTEVKAQFNTQPIYTYAEFKTVGGSNSLPLWHYANVYGETKPGSSFTTLGILHAEQAFTEPGEFWGLAAGATGVVRLSDTQNTLHMRQLYLSADAWLLNVRLGLFHDDMEQQFPDITSGSMMVSRNATPHPKYMIATRGFIDLPFTNGIVQFKGTFADGILERDRYVEQPLFHQKTGHLKFNVGPVELIAGFIHNVMWAGTDPERGRLPSSLRDYFRVVIPRPAGEGSTASAPEQENRLGNTVAAYDGALIVQTGVAEVVAYRQIYLEDTVSMTNLRSYMDGLFGLGLRNITFVSWLDDIVLEHVNTIKQDSQPGFPSGRGNYYNHYAYRTGYSYQGNGIGSPLLSYSRTRGLFRNNMVLAWHLGASGSINERLSYRFMGTYTRNYGNCRIDLIIAGSCFINEVVPPTDDFAARPRRDTREDYYYFLAEATYLLDPSRRIELTASLAADDGIYRQPETRIGVMLGLRITDFHSLIRS